jgi:hypothetical protein
MAFIITVNLVLKHVNIVAILFHQLTHVVPICPAHFQESVTLRCKVVQISVANNV